MAYKTVAIENIVLWILLSKEIYLTKTNSLEKTVNFVKA